jgi:putative endonuclease
MYEHKNKKNNGFTEKYNVGKLVYYEYTDNVESAIVREKQIKGLSRQKKDMLVIEQNPDWKDLSAQWA